MKKTTKQTLITGRQPVIEALKAGTSIERIFISRQSGGASISLLRKLARELTVPVHAVPEEKLNRLHPARRSGKANDQGCIAVVSRIRYLELQQVISHVMESGEAPLFVMIDGITDVRNIGAMARSALCCDSQALILPEKGVASLNEEAVKSSAGALEHLAVCRVADLAEALNILRLNGFQILASNSSGNRYLHDCDWTVPTVVIMGAEDKGVQPVLLKSADATFKIPMAAGFDSFNVSVATGIILYEALKQRSF